MLGDACNRASTRRVDAMTATEHRRRARMLSIRDVRRRARCILVFSEARETLEEFLLRVTAPEFGKGARPHGRIIRFRLVDRP